MLSHIGSLIIGDLNVWNCRWLGHSPSDTPAGLELESQCKQYGLKQIVKEPTRDENLLDLVLTTMPDQTIYQLTPKIADHKGVLVTLKQQAITEVKIERRVWNYKRADWTSLSTDLKTTNWNEILNLDAENACSSFTRLLQQSIRRYIPEKVLIQTKRSYP